MLVRSLSDVSRCLKLLTFNLGENHLSFIETSALDASNVELAFQNILTGTYLEKISLLDRCLNQSYSNAKLSPEIYRIVSSKALDSGEGAQAPMAGTNISLSKSPDDAAKQGGKCC